MKAKELTIKVLLKDNEKDEPAIPFVIDLRDCRGCLDYKVEKSENIEVENLCGMEVDYDDWIS